MQNHNAKPVGSQAVPAAHANTYQHYNKRGRGRGRGHFDWSSHGGRGTVGWSPRGGRGWPQRGGRGRLQRGGRYRGFNNISRFSNYEKGESSRSALPKERSSHSTHDKNQLCHRCGCQGHWSRTCRTPKHLVDAYQRLQKDKKGKVIQGESHHASLPDANLVFDADDNDLLKLELEDYGDAT